VTGPVIETERLTLRPPAVEDFPRWCELMADPEASRFIGGPLSPAQTWRSLMTMAGFWALTGEGMFSVMERSSGLWLGRIGPLHPYGWPGTEVGWSLHPEAHGHGYAVEAATATIDYAFDHLGWADVIHCIAPENLASARVAEKLGSTNRGPGVLPDPFAHEQVDIWGQTREQWRARRR
jgi:RimJ/RimL family protein N-acetyltransferase